MIKYFKEGAVLPKKLEVAKGLAEHSVAELRELANAKGIELPAKATKAEIVKALSEKTEGA